MTRAKYNPRFPKLFKQWRKHDLAIYRPVFYEHLHPSDELAVWEFIETEYICKYTDLVLVAFEWSAYGLWGIPFPGSVQMGECLAPDDFDMPPGLERKIKHWHDYHDANAQPWEDNDTFDYKASHDRGFAVAKAVKMFLGDEYYVEFHPFQEIRIIRGKAVESPIPEFIKTICKPK